MRGKEEEDYEPWEEEVDWFGEDNGTDESSFI